ncbi:hypothetical protein GYMLUDRAFT_257389 [Collybiopsis luxurians FD-317 M1]|nr:hypothetical protein GYMLUDRAFT_257389 [Collybiopsis luxurians FD-317 M1]
MSPQGSLKEKSSDDFQDIEDKLPNSVSGSTADERRTMRSVDWHVLPIFIALNIAIIIDRVNIGSARTIGMGDDLKVTNVRYNIVVCISFIPFILLEIPSNLVIHKLNSSRVYISIMAILWGLVLLGSGFVKTWGQLAACRALMGIFEAGFYPGLFFVMSTWYTRYELQIRIAIVNTSSLFISGFGAILAYGLSRLNGKSGIAGWAWIFIIEGAITVALGILGFFVIPEFPDRNKFLTAEQTALVLSRVEADRGDSLRDSLTRTKIIHHLRDWKLWAYGVMYGCSVVPTFTISYFMPIIINGMGFSTADSLLLLQSPFSLYDFLDVKLQLEIRASTQVFTTVFLSWLSDKSKHRAGFLVIQTLVTIAGICTIAFAPLRGARYFGGFLIDAGSLGTSCGILAYQTIGTVRHNQSVQWDSGNSSKSYNKIFRGFCVALGAQVVLILVLALTTMNFRRLNKLAESGKAIDPLEGQSGFRYTL